MPSDPVGLIPGHWIAAMLLLSIAAFAALLAIAGQDFDVATRIDRALLVGGAAALIVRYRLRRPRTAGDTVIRDLIEHISVFVVICLLGAMASYPVAALSHGFMDARIQWLDDVLHLDWMTWYTLVATHPPLQWAGTLVYESIFVTPILILGYHALTGRRAEARRFVASFWLAAVITLAFFYFVPAKGPLAYLYHGTIPYMPASALFQSEIIPLLRAHSVHAVSANNLHGLVCMPSFHTTSGVLFIIAAWPLKPLRWPMVALNAAMLLATPVEGTHYFVDMVAGAVIAIGARLAIGALCRRLPPESLPQALPAWRMWRARRLPARRGASAYGSDFDRYRDDLRRMNDRDLIGAFSSERSAGPRARAMADEIDRRNLSG